MEKVSQVVRRLTRRVRWRLRSLKHLLDPDWWELRRKQREHDKLHKRWWKVYIKKNTVAVAVQELLRAPFIFAPYIPMMVLPTYRERSYREQIEELEEKMRKMELELE